MEKVLTNDLDNNLIANEVYSGINRGAYGAVSTTPIKPIQTEYSLSENGGSDTTMPIKDPKSPPKTGNGIGTASPLPSDETPTKDGRGDDGMTTMPVDEDKFPQEELPSLGGGGYGGGGGGAMPHEEEIIGEGLMIDDSECKILTRDCKLFYILLGVTAIGGYLWYKNKT